MRFKKVLGLVTALCLISCSTGCGATEKLEVPQQDLTVAVLTKAQNTEFWDTVELGANNAGEELGIKIVYQATPTEADIDRQIDMIDKLVSQGVDSIVIAPLDTEKLNNALREAVKNGIDVLTIDSTVNYTEVTAEIGTQNLSAGAIAATKMASLVNSSGDVAIIAHGTDDVLTSYQRKQGFIDKIEETYKDIKIVATENCNSDKDTAKEIAKKLLTDNPNLKGIYATNEVTAVGVCEVVKEMGLTGKIRVIGFDSSSTEIEFLKEGVLSGMLVQDPYLFGYLGVRNAYKAINNERVDGVIDTGVTFVDKSNLNDEDVKAILYPLGKEN